MSGFAAKWKTKSNARISSLKSLGWIIGWNFRGYESLTFSISAFISGLMSKKPRRFSIILIKWFNKCVQLSQKIIGWNFAICVYIFILQIFFEIGQRFFEISKNVSFVHTLSKPHKFTLQSFPILDWHDNCVLLF